MIAVIQITCKINYLISNNKHNIRVTDKILILYYKIIVKV
jgi:hypothetical protein